MKGRRGGTEGPPRADTSRKARADMEPRGPFSRKSWIRGHAHREARVIRFFVPPSPPEKIFCGGKFHPHTVF